MQRSEGEREIGTWWNGSNRSCAINEQRGRNESKRAEGFWSLASEEALTNDGVQKDEKEAGDLDAISSTYSRPETGESFQVDGQVQAATWMIKVFRGHH